MGVRNGVGSDFRIRKITPDPISPPVESLPTPLAIVECRIGLGRDAARIPIIADGGADSLSELKQRFTADPANYIIPLSAAGRRESYER